MCVVSMITDHYKDRWAPLVPQQPTYPVLQPMQPIVLMPSISPEEVAEFRKLLERARDYDKRMGQPACEMDEKIAALKLIAKALGVDISFIDTVASDGA